MAKLNPDYIKWVLTLNASQAQEEYHKLEKANKALKAETNATRKAMAQLEAEGKKGSTEWENLRKSISQNSRAMSENRTKMGELFKKIDEGAMTLKDLRRHLNELKTQFNNTSKAADPKRYKDLQRQISNTQQAIYRATGQTDKLKNSFLSLSKIKSVLLGFFTSMGVAIAGFVTGAFSNAFNIIVEFEKANSKLAAILGTSKEGIKELTAAARELGATTSYSAAQVTELQIELAKLGFNQDQILAMESGVLKFAKAVDTDLASASAFAGAALRIFGKDAKDTEDVLATFAIATTKTSLDFAKLESSLATVGPVAHSFGLTVEDTTALLGQLANAGFDASSAATATRNILLNLCDANGSLAQALGKPVTSLDDLAAGLQKLNAEGVDLAKALDLTDKRSVAAFSTFLEQADGLVALRDSITGVTGDFNKMAETMANNVSGSLAGLRSATEEVILKIGDSTSGPIKSIVDGLTTVVRKIGDVVEWFQRWWNILGPIAKAITAYIVVLKSLRVAWNAVTITAKHFKSVVSGLGQLFAVAYSGVKNMIRGIISFGSAVKAGTLSLKAMDAAIKSIPWARIASAIASLVFMVYDLVKSLNQTTESTKKLSEAEERSMTFTAEAAKRRADFEAKLNSEKKTLAQLIKVAEDESASKKERLAAIDKLNKICPSYNGHLDSERGKLIANKKAMDEYIASMEKRMRIAYYKDEYQKYLTEQEAAIAEYNNLKRRYDKEESLRKQEAKNTTDVKFERNVMPTEGFNNGKASTSGYNVSGRRLGVESRLDPKSQPMVSSRDLESAKNAIDNTSDALKEFKQTVIDAGLTITEVLAGDDDTGLSLLNNAGSDASSSLSGAASATHKVVDEVKSLRDELKKLRKEEPQTDEEYERIEKRKKQIRDRLKEINGTDSKKKNKREPGTYGEDSIDEATASADDLHQKNMLDINKQKGQISEAEFIIKKNQELIRYSSDLIKALEKLRGETDATHTKTLDKIDAEQNKILQDVLAAQQAIDAATVRQQKEIHDDSLKALTAGYEAQKNVMQRAVNDKIITQEQSDIYMMARERQLHEDQLAELNRYYREVKASDLIGAAEKTRTLEDLDGKIRQMTSQTLTDAGKWSEKIRELSTNTSGFDGIKNGFELQRKALLGTYDQAIAIQQKLGQDTTALEAERQRRLAELNYQYQEQMWQLQENVGMSWADEYDRELASLENMHRQGLIKEKDYQKKKLELGVNNAKKYFDYYSQLSGSMFSAIQEAEIAQVDAKYDVMIQAAKNNGEDTAALEEEKENKKLEIQKKYADVDFAIKISEIIANTAVAIMTGFKQLGPIGGAIAAAMLTATGIAQVATAKAERDKIKNMQPGNTAGASKTPAKAERVLSGYSEGGYTGDGDRYEVAGLVHRGEYVVPKPIMDNPRVVDAVGTIEAIRRNRRPRPVDDYSRMPEEFAEGGFTGSSTVTVDTSELATAVKDLRLAIKNMRAYVLLKDIHKAEEDQARARSPFTRNSK